ncbi:hypothetical protein GCM10028805_24060 [Spirosoma harenae]
MGWAQSLGWAQQFMLPTPSRQWNQPYPIKFFDKKQTDEQKLLIWQSNQSSGFSFDGHHFQLTDESQPGKARYRLAQSEYDGRIWVMEDRVGQPRQLAYVDLARRQIVNLPDSSQLVKMYLHSQGFSRLYLGKHGKIWLSLPDNLLVGVNSRTLTVECVVKAEAPKDLSEAPDGRIWFNTPTGLAVLNPKTGQRWDYQHDPQQPDGLSKGEITAIRVRDNGDVLLGLPNEINILTPSTGKIRKIKLPLPTAASHMWTDAFIPDRAGNDYFSVGLMVCRISPQGQLQRIDFSHPAEKIISLFINSGEGSGPDRLWVRVISGRIDEYDLSRLRATESFNILDVIVNGTRLIENEHTQEDRFQRDSTGYPSIRIEEGEFVQIRFTAFADSRESRFRYKVDSYSPQWSTYSDFVGVATYQLSAGTYHFLFDRQTPAGWQKQPASLRIEVQPIIWKTLWFRSLVLIVLVGLGFWVIRSANRRRKLRKELARREFEAATLRQMDELKSQFFANITHEFRTPLTIILNATEQLADEPNTSRRADRLNTIQRNANQLLRLINETLEMTRLDAGRLDKRDYLGDPIAFVYQMVAQFKGLAEQKNLELNWSSPIPTDDHPDLYHFDQDKLEKITYNLLANAIKFTHTDGQIQVEALMTEEQNLVFRVSDSGIGIPTEQLARIFDRFHQVDSSSTKAYSGTGIGLALVKELTEWLGGSVNVESAVGKGSQFTVSIPLKIYESSEAAEAILPQPIDVDSKLTDVIPVAEPAANFVKNVALKDDKRSLVLVVEDNAELRRFVVDYLAKTYQVITAENGLIGLQKAQDQIPDLIISDVMMPGIDGFELVERLKANECTSHIPVVLLTAKSSYDSRMKGLGVGADDYLGKPFSLAELRLRINNVLQTRQNWQCWLTNRTGEAGQTTTADPQLNREDKFLTRMRQIVLDHLNVQTMDVDWLADQASMSRAQLHRKLTALTTLSPNRFIHRVRIEKAAELLRTGELNVAQIAYSVGYSSPSHFTKVFREHFGYAPTKVKE